MKHFAKRITALLLLLLMTASLLASCSGEAEKSSDEPKTIATYDDYVANTIDFGLGDGETLMEIIEIDGELRATVGIADMDEDLDGIYRHPVPGIPYETEHRYYNMEFAEDTSKRESTISSHEVALFADPTVDFVFGGEPFLYTQTETGIPRYYGVLYHFYRDGQIMDEIIVPEHMVDGNNVRFANYNAYAHLMLYEDVVYAGINYEGVNSLYVNDHFVSLPNWTPGLPEYEYCGLIGIDGIPCALVCAWETTRDEQIVDTLWEETRLIPLSPDTTELSLEGTKIDGKATGGAFSDGKYGYFMCGSELWRTDGKDSKRIADLIFNGVSETSEIRSVRALSDGRILVVADGKLLELTGKDGNVTDDRRVFTVGVVNLYGPLYDLQLTFSKFNGISGDVAFTVKEFDDKASLNLALLSGEISIVITRDQFMLKNYVNQDLLLPLDEVAPELFEKGVLIENIADATRIDGTCYYLPRHFDIRGGITNARIVEEAENFETHQGFYDFVNQKDPRYFKNQTKQSIFMTFAQDVDEWIDWETNSCHFDDGSFEALLDFCNQGSTQEEVDNYMYQSDSYIIDNSTFVLRDSVQSNFFADVTDAKEYLEKLPAAKPGEEGLPTNDVRVIYPYPSSVHDGFEIFTPHYFAVVDNEVSREAAGEFLKWHFLENVVEDFTSAELFYHPAEGFSLNKEENDRYLSRNIDGFIDVTPDPALPADVQMYVMADNMNHNMKCGQEQYEKTWDLISRADHFQYFRNEVFDVMLEEARRVFYNAITAKQAADYVQNRISLYLAEQS